jgi:hypothetical protein
MRSDKVNSASLWSPLQYDQARSIQDLRDLHDRGKKTGYISLKNTIRKLPDWWWETASASRHIIERDILRSASKTLESCSRIWLNGVELKWQSLFVDKISSTVKLCFGRSVEDTKNSSVFLWWDNDSELSEFFDSTLTFRPTAKTASLKKGHHRCDAGKRMRSSTAQSSIIFGSSNIAMLWWIEIAKTGRGSFIVLYRPFSISI